MTRERVINRIIHSKNNPNSQLLKKFILTAQRGWLRTNNQSPDRAINLADYLFDNERIIFDFNELSLESKKKFMDWFYKPHAEQAERVYLSGVATSDYRGYTAEVEFSWWGRIANLLFYKKKSHKWSLAPFEVTLDYQLTGIEMAEGKNGLLISLNQFGEDDLSEKYHAKGDDQEKPLRNTKRVLLTDSLVNELVETNLDREQYGEMLECPHPYSINVISPENRYKAMHDHRVTERFIILSPWYVRLARWIRSFSEQVIDVVTGQSNKSPEPDNSLELILDLEDQNIQVFRRKHTREIVVIEKRPDLDSNVFCGGGAKIFSHVGSYRAFEEAGIKAKKFAGSSAGAIMAILCYLGYNSQEIEAYFQQFRKDNLIHYQIDRSGLSTTEAMKAGLDYMKIKKIHQIIQEYQIDQSEEGRDFLQKKVFCRDIITFDALAQLKNRYPDCGIGDKLVITATNIKKHQTDYFSHELTPFEEPSHIGSTSASLPVVFKPSIFNNGEAYNDGGILSNLPTEVFHDDHSTFLRSEHGNCLKLVAFQFDNGPEGHILTSLVDRVYRENFVLNWIYSILTGVKDPASGWQRDREKLKRHAGQVVLVNTGDISATKFDLTPEDQSTLINSGYKATNQYIDAHYRDVKAEPFVPLTLPWYVRFFNWLQSPWTASAQKPELKKSDNYSKDQFPPKKDPDEIDRNIESRKAINSEWMHHTFASIEEALYYCCHRERKDMFDKFAERAIFYGDLKADKINELAQKHFNPITKPKVIAENKPDTTLENAPSTLASRMRLFEEIYPIFLKMPLTAMKNEQDQMIYRGARHTLSLKKPEACLQHLNRIKGETHLLMQVFIDLIKGYHQACEQSNDSEITFVCEQFKLLKGLLPYIDSKPDALYWGNWSLPSRNINKLLEAFKSQEWDTVNDICKNLKNNEEPLHLINGKLFDKQSIKEESENFNNRGIERNRSFSST